MKKLLSLLLVATIITSTLCVSYFAFDNVDNLSNITTSEPTDKEIETSTISTSDEATPDEATPDEITTEPSSPTTESSTIESSTEPSSSTTGSSTIESSTEPSSSTTESSTIESSTEPSSSTTESSTIESSTEPTTTKPTDIKVSSVKLNTKNHTMYSNQYVQLKATVLPNNAYNKSVTWKSSNSKIATVDKNGKVKALKVGNAIITATSTDGSNVSAQCKIKVVQRVTKIKLNKSIINLSKKGKTAKLKATVLPNNAYNKSVTWKANNTKVVTVDVPVTAPTTVATESETKASFMFGIFPSLSTIPARDAVPTSVPMVSNISMIQNVMMSEIAVNHPILMKSLKSNLNSVVSAISLNCGTNEAVASDAKGFVPKNIASPAQ